MAMAAVHLRREERVGLGVAITLHLAIVLAFILQPKHRVDMQPTQRMTVSLVDEAGLTDTAPQPVPESRAAIAPELSQMPVPPVKEPPRPVAKEETAAPVEKLVPARKPSPAPREAAAKQTEAHKPEARPEKPKGGSLLGDNFLAGLGSSTKTSETRAPASQIGPEVKASLIQAIARQLKPHWTPPDGPDVEKITTYVRFRLNPDGSLEGRPQVVNQTGVNSLNRPQAARHAELAVRAVQLAAPFNLPKEYYESWKVVTANLDWRLAQ